MRAARRLQTIVILSILLSTFLFGSLSANPVTDGKPEGTVVSLEKRGGRRLILGGSAARSLLPSYDPRHDPPVTPDSARRFGAKTT